jgi:hypothetical protein
MLPLEWVDKLFLKLAVIYGSEVVRKYQGIDAQAVKQEWSNILGGFSNRPEAIKFALDHLPSDRCPNALQFRDLCRQFVPATPALSAPKETIDPALLSAVMSALKPIDGLHDSKSWAKKLKARHESGERLSLVQIKSYKEVLHDT